VEFVNNLFRTKSRLMGMLFMLAGFGMAVNLWFVYRDGGSFRSKDLSYTPLMIALGLGILIEPRLLTVWVADEEHPVPTPTRFKAIGIAIAVISGIIGIYLGSVVFKDWERVPLSELGSPAGESGAVAQ
jgi:hypothetical protein